jgi:hypothetical protein
MLVHIRTWIMVKLGGLDVISLCSTASPEVAATLSCKMQGLGSAQNPRTIWSRRGLTSDIEC